MFSSSVGLATGAMSDGATAAGTGATTEVGTAMTGATASTGTGTGAATGVDASTGTGTGAVTATGVGAVGVVTCPSSTITMSLYPLSNIRTQSTFMVAGSGAVMSSGVRNVQPEPLLPLLPPLLLPHPDEELLPPLLLLPEPDVKPPPTATFNNR